MLCSCGKEYNGETSRPLKVRLEEHRKSVITVETIKSGIADHVWRDKSSHQPQWNEVKILDREEHRRKCISAYTRL